MDKIYRLSFLYSCQGGLNPGGGRVGCGSARWLRVMFLASTPILSRRENSASHLQRRFSEHTVLQLQPARPNNLFTGVVRLHGMRLTNITFENGASTSSNCSLMRVCKSNSIPRPSEDRSRVQARSLLQCVKDRPKR